MSLIEQSLYNEILRNMPIICVDGVILNENGEILFLKRKNEPEKNKWWFPGGRLLKNEYLESAIVRKFKEEVNIKSTVIKFLGVTETIFETGPYEIPVHTVNFTYLMSAKDYTVKIDDLHSEFIWSNKYLELDLNKEILDLIKNNF